MALYEKACLSYTHASCHDYKTVLRKTCMRMLYFHSVQKEASSVVFTSGISYLEKQVANQLCSLRELRLSCHSVCAANPREKNNDERILLLFPPRRFVRSPSFVRVWKTTAHVKRVFISFFPLVHNKLIRVAYNVQVFYGCCYESRRRNNV